MPKFSEYEKERIQQCLLEEGEYLFITYGLKKVTIDDIVKAVNIAKATFYKFYEGKEYLFLDIAQRNQQEIFHTLQETLKESVSKTEEERVRLVFFKMSELMKKYPLLTQIDTEIAEAITRKVAPQRLLAFNRQGLNAVKAMEQNGIKFRYNTDIISKLFQALYQSWIGLQHEPKEVQKQVIDIMLDGIMKQIL